MGEKFILILYCMIIFNNQILSKNDEKFIWNHKQFTLYLILEFKQLDKIICILI